MGDVVKLNPNAIATVDDLFAQAKELGLTKAMLIGTDDNGKPYINATGNALLSELAWFAMMGNAAVHDLMNDS